MKTLERMELMFWYPRDPGSVIKPTWLRRRRINAMWWDDLDISAIVEVICREEDKQVMCIQTVVDRI